MIHSPSPRALPGGFLWLMLRAFVFSLFLSLPQIVEYLSSGGSSPGVFSDWDEPAYLPYSLKVGSGFTGNNAGSYADAAAAIDAIYLERPEFVTDVAVGSLGAVCGLSAAELGLVLDLLAAVLSFLAFRLLFQTMSGCRFSGELAAFVTLGFPSLITLAPLIPENQLLFGSIVSTSLHEYPGIPVLRAVYTQCSYPIFALSLFSVLTALSNRTKLSRMLWSAGAGFATGLLIYVYFFGWLAASFLSGALYFVVYYSTGRGLQDPHRFRAVPLEFLPPFVLSYLLTACPGLIRLFQLDAQRLAPSPDALQFYFASIESVLLICLVAVSLFVSKKESGIIAAGLALAALLGESLIANLQPLTGVATLPYHSSSFYFYPLLGGLAIVSLFHFVDRFEKSEQVQLRFRQGFALVLILLFILTTVGRYRVLERGRIWTTRFTELVRFLRDEIPGDATFTMISYSNPFDNEASAQDHLLTPVWASALSGKKLAQNFYTFDAARRLWDELMMGLLYRGGIRMITACDHFTRIDPLRVFNGGDPVLLPTVKAACAAYAAEKSRISFCDIVRRGLPDYLVWEESIMRGPPPQDGTEEVFRSSGGEYLLLKLNKVFFRTRYCS